ncbi:MAG: hypothetical protein ABIH37_03315 [archaeon]
MVSAILERHYAPDDKKTTDNMEGVLIEIPRDVYDTMVHRIGVYGEPPSERGLGLVVDQTRYYTFEGNNVFLENGLAQAGMAKTTDNRDGFEMTRIFANSLDQIGKLEVECGLRV